jgi:tetratricopeptide (TPR) repeat protein
MKQAVLVIIGALAAVGVLWTVRMRQLTAAESDAAASSGPKAAASAVEVKRPEPIRRIDVAATRRRFAEEIGRNPSSFELRMQAATFFTVENLHREALPHLQRAVELKPDSLVAWIALGDAGTMAGRYEVAERAYRRAEEMSAGNPLIYRGRGQMHVIRKQFAQARRVFEEGVARNPRDTELRFALASLLLIMNFPRDAAQVMEPAVAQEPNRPEYHYTYGEALERDLHMERAAEQMEIAVKLAPDYTQAWGRLGLYRKDLTRYAAAREALERAIALNPKESYYHWALGDCFQMDAGVADGVQRAEACYQKAIALNPRNEKALYAYGMLLSRKGTPEDLRRAAGYFERLLKIKPEDMNVEFKLAEFYTRTGQPEKAKPHRERFKALFNKGRDQNVEIYQKTSFLDTASAHLKLGTAAMQRGDFALAAKEFRFALERDPQLRAAQEGLASAQHALETGRTR